MPDQSRFVGNSIEELLVALAEGVREAQAALASTDNVDAAGRPLPGYHLPYLDFSINVEMETRSDSGGRPVALLFKSQPGTSTTQQVTSTIAGRLVATPPGDGLPIPRIDLLPGVNIGGEVRLDLRLSNSAGEVLAGRTVELNVDDAASTRLTDMLHGIEYRRLAGSRLKDALLTTGSDGVAQTLMSIDGAQDRRTMFVVVATLGSASGKATLSAEVLG
jgi:hypothetical protein